MNNIRGSRLLLRCIFLVQQTGGGDHTSTVEKNEAESVPYDTIYATESFFQTSTTVDKNEVPSVTLRMVSTL